MSASLNRRILRVDISHSDGFKLSVDQQLALEVTIEKNCLDPNTNATILVYNLTDHQRNILITRVSKYNYWYNQNNLDNARAWVTPVVISAGYEINKQEQVNLIFQGQLITAELTSGPPDVGVRLMAITNYFSRSDFKFYQLNSNLTYKQFALWVGKQLNLTVNCNTLYDDQTITNAGIGASNGQGLIAELNQMFYSKTLAWVDNTILNVIDLGDQGIDDELLDYDNFLGVPQYNETGAQFKIMFDHRVTVGKKVHLKSLLDPLTFHNQSFTVFKCLYRLTSRSNEFSVTAWCQQ